MMRKFMLFISFILFSSFTSAQIYDPATWGFRFENKGDKQYELIFTVSIDENSHIYSMDIPDGGPIPTSFRFDTIPAYKLVGKAYEVTKPVELNDEAFGFKIKTFSNKAEFRQKITAIEPSFTVTGVVNYMACNNATCSPPKDVDFAIKISDQAAGQVIKSNNSSAAVSIPSVSKSGMLKLFLISLLDGFAGVLTPCVFPMIPMTVAFFSQGSENRSKSVFKALIFGISIILIYSSLGLIVSLTSAGAGFANTLSTHWIPNALFFALFIIFAASFFGAFEIMLPNKWVTTADSKVDRGGILAAFFMGLTTVIVSFSCTGPIIGALLVEAAGGDVLRPTVGMIGFG